MKSRWLALLGVACLIIAQVIATGPLAHQRAAMTPNRDVYDALTPGEFAGTLMLGGFRGLACDLLWVRADNAKNHGQLYESLALFQTISRIQPRFEQIWTYMSWDLAYNISNEVEDEEGKWAWFLAGIDTNVQGCLRNPHSERLLRNLAWMFHHKGDRFHDRILARSWGTSLQPILDAVNRQLPTSEQLPALSTTVGGTSNFRLSAIFYLACQRLAEADNQIGQTPFVRRMVPLAIENDGNLLRNHGQHLAALRVYLESLQSWQSVAEHYAAISLSPAKSDALQLSFGLDSYERNEGRLRRSSAQLARELHSDPERGAAVAKAILTRHFTEAAKMLDEPGWKKSADHGHIRWLDEP